MFLQDAIEYSFFESIDGESEDDTFEQWEYNNEVRDLKWDTTH